MKKLFLVALAAVGLASCVQNEELAVAGSTTAIAFGDSFVYNATKADPTTTTATIDNFDVWAFMDEVGGTVLTDEDVTKVNGAWGYQNLQYWAPNHTYYFAALSPANSANVTEDLAEGDAAKLGLGEITFTNVDGTEDLLYAKAKETTGTMAELAANGKQPVVMQFQHLLSKVKFSFQNGFTTENMTVKVSEVTMKAAGSASINLAQTDYNWTGHAGETTLAFGETAVLDHTATGEATDERLTIPASSAYEYTVTFDVVVYSGSVEAFKEENKTATIKGYELEMGKAYNFTAVINADSFGLHPIEFKAEVDPWDTEVEVPVYEYEADGFGVDSNTGINHVTNLAGLQYFADQVNGGRTFDGETVVLNGDIDLSTSRSLASNWTPINEFTGTFDGKGHTIKNLVLAPDESANWYVGFFGYAKNATIKNVVFENVNVLVGGDDTNQGGHIAAVVGALEGTSTIENVTVKGNVYIEADVTKNSTSRVAAVVGGNGYGNVTVKNVHVIANEGSYVKANNCVGAIAGQLNNVASFENCSSNIDVTGTKFFAGGIIGVAPTQATFVNCHTTGDVAITAGRSGKPHDHYRVGGIAGGWDDNTSYPCVLTNCSYTGKLTGVNSDGSVADKFAYLGYVGRGYTISGKDGSKVVIDGIECVQTAAGVYTINGLTPVSTADELVAALAAGKGVYLLNDITVAATKGGYDKAGILQNKAQTIDGGGNTLTVTGAGATWNCAIYTNGGTIKNLTVKGAMRGIFTAGLSADLHIENVEFKNVIYTFNSDGKTMPANPFGVYVSNSKVNGWTSHSNIHTEVVYTNCSFGEGSGYKYCRPYGKTSFVGCTFCAGYTLDQSQTTDITLTDCIFEL